MLMKRIITIGGKRWLCEAVSRVAMLNEIALARATGSIGGSSYVQEFPNGKERLVSRVIQINDDYSERQPS